MSKTSRDRSKRKSWPLAVFLISACIVPIAAGAYRGTTLILDNDWGFEFDAAHVDSLPLFLHVICAATFYVLAALQVWPPLRTRFPVWHQRAGRVAIIAGLVGALSSVWITIVHAEVRGDILFYGRMVFGPLWALFLVLGYLAIRRKDVRAHRAWMVRAFAVAMPAGTLIFIFAPVLLIFGEVSSAVDESIQSTAWIVHLALAEWLLRRLPSGPPPAACPRSITKKKEVHSCGSGSRFHCWSRRSQGAQATTTSKPKGEPADTSTLDR